MTAPFKGGGGVRRFACPLLLLSFWDEEGSEMTITAKGAQVHVSPQQGASVSSVGESHGTGGYSRDTRLHQIPFPWAEPSWKDPAWASRAPPNAPPAQEDGLECDADEAREHGSPSSAPAKARRSRPRSANLPEPSRPRARTRSQSSAQSPSTRRKKAAPSTRTTRSRT